MDSDAIFESIVSSQRQFNNFLLDTCKVTQLQQLYRLKTIAFKFGPDITDFTWESCKLSKAEIITLLNFMPNCESLTAIAWKLQTETYDEPVPLLTLNSLVNLKVTRFDKSTIEFFSLLPQNVIKKLNLQGDPEEFLAKQQSIEKLELHVDSFNSNDLHKMSLSELKLKLRRYKNDDEISIIQSTIEKQHNLSAVDLVGCEGCFDGDDGAFVAICNLKQLQSLKLNIDELSSGTFVEHFGKLKNLRTLELESVEHNYSPIVVIIDELCHMEMPRLENLKIYLSDVGVPLDRIERMGRKFKSLKCLTIRCDRPLPLDCYLANLENLTSLHIDYHYSKEFAKLCNNYQIKCNSLKHLSLQGFSFGSDDVNWNELTLLMLADIVPNLEVLDTDASFPFNTDFILRIMQKLAKLETIKSWSMVQSGENYHKFDQVSVFNLKRIASILNQFSIELRLKAIDMDVSRVKEDLSSDFDVAMTRLGSFIKIRMEKK